MREDAIIEIKNKDAVKDIASKATAFYLDGNEVGPETIDIKFYKFSYDEDTGTVYLTKLDENSSSFFIVPFVRPM